MVNNGLLFPYQNYEILYQLNFLKFSLYPFNRNCKLNISTAPTKVKLWEPAYSQALNQNKSIDMQRVKIQRVRPSYVYGGWCLEFIEEGCMRKRMN